MDRPTVLSLVGVSWRALPSASPGPDDRTYRFSFAPAAVPVVPTSTFPRAARARLYLLRASSSLCESGGGSPIALWLKCASSRRKSYLSYIIGQVSLAGKGSGANLRHSVNRMNRLIVASGLWTLLGVIIMAVTWRRWRRSKPSAARIFFWSFIIAVFFTPFIPHASVQWSTPWPPAFLWLFFALVSGETMPFELFTIGGAMIVLWIAGYLISRQIKGDMRTAAAAPTPQHDSTQSKL